MGLLTDVVVALPDEAAAICAEKGAHAAKWPCFESKGLDNSALAALLTALGHADAAAALEGGEGVVFQESPEGSWVFHLPDVLRDSLSTLPLDGTPAVAERWVKQEELALSGVQAEDVLPVIDQLRALAARAKVAEKPLLLWMSL